MEKLVRHTCTGGTEAELPCVWVFFSLPTWDMTLIPKSQGLETYVFIKGAEDMLFSFPMACLPKVPLQLHFLKSLASLKAWSEQAD